MKEKLIKRLYNYWACTDDDLNNGLWENISDIINNKGKNGAEDLLDWCRDDYDRAKENYMELYNYKFLVIHHYSLSDNHLD